MTVELQQKQRTFLRERFLRLLAGINDQRAEFLLVNGNSVFARFCVSDLDILQFQVIICGRHITGFAFRITLFPIRQIFRIGTVRGRSPFSHLNRPYPGIDEGQVSIK